MNDLDYEPNYRELATAILTQAYVDAGNAPAYKHVCLSCWKPWESTLQACECPRCGKVNRKGDFKGYRPASDVAEFLKRDWSAVLCDYVGVRHSEYKRRVLRYSGTNRIERG